jgi:hypothetical protein
MPVLDLAGHRVLDPVDLPVRTERDVSDLVGALFGEDVDRVILRVERLDPAFFDLRTGLAGAILQKLTNYRVDVAIVGDVAAVEGEAFRAFVAESNRGRHVWFVPDVDALAVRLARPG